MLTTLNNQLTQSKMNAESIATYISNLEKDNAALKKLLQQCEEEKAILEYESMLHYAQVSDDESVVSDSDSSTMAQITGGEPYESDSDATTVGKPDETEETDHDSDYEADSDYDYFISYNYDMTKAFDDLAAGEENEHKKRVYQKAANNIFHYPSKIKYGEQIAHISGIGQGIIRRIDEYLGTETLTTDSESEYEYESESDLLSPLKGKN